MTAQTVQMTAQTVQMTAQTVQMTAQTVQMTEPLMMAQAILGMILVTLVALVTLVGEAMEVVMDILLVQSCQLRQDNQWFQDKQNAFH
jgi:hypothetical protein